MRLDNPLVQGVLLAAIVGAASFAANTLSAAASSDDVTKALVAHAVHPHPSTAAQLQAHTDADSRHATELAKLEGTPAQIRGITARIDLIVLSGAERSPKRFRRAAAKIRSAARSRGENDPLAGLEGL